MLLHPQLAIIRRARRNVDSQRDVGRSLTRLAVRKIHYVPPDALRIVTARSHLERNNVVHHDVITRAVLSVVCVYMCTLLGHQRLLNVPRFLLRIVTVLRRLLIRRGITGILRLIGRHTPTVIIVSLLMRVLTSPHRHLVAVERIARRLVRAIARHATTIRLGTGVRPCTWLPQRAVRRARDGNVRHRCVRPAMIIGSGTRHRDATLASWIAAMSYTVRRALRVYLQAAVTRTSTMRLARSALLRLAHHLINRHRAWSAAVTL